MSNSKTAYIGLGSNLGDKSANIKNALKMLAQADCLRLLNSSDIICSKPLTGSGQSDYLNCVAQIETGISSRSLLKKLKDIEKSLGRKETVQKWSSREIDLDILIFGEEIINTPTLTLPHPQLHLRSFALAGLCQLDAQIVHPVIGDTVSVLAERLGGGSFFIEPRKPKLISIAGVIGAGKTTLAGALIEQFDCRLIKEAYETNPFMKQVYAGARELALDSQLYFLLSRTEQLSAESIGRSSVSVSDYIIDKEMIYAAAWLEGEQLSLYKKINSRIRESVVAPAVVIYLRLAPEICLERIHSRNRPYEQKIDLDFLKKLDIGYEQLFKNWNRCPLFRIDGAEFDFRRKSHAQTLTAKLRHYTL